MCQQIEELEQARELGDKTELDELLDNARKEKDALESQVALLQEQLSRSQCETARLRDQVTHLQEECKVRHAMFCPKDHCPVPLRFANEVILHTLTSA
jgi:transcription elongation GreA/GreB family factor